MNDVLNFKRMEFEIEARCIHCGAFLFSETAVDEPDGHGGVVETQRYVRGNLDAATACNCRRM